MIRNLLLVCTTLTVVALLFYTVTERTTRADFTYVNPSGIHTLDPARMSWTQDFRVALNIWEGLTTSDPQSTAPMEGAARFPPHISADQCTYTFTIRDDARWSNGDPVTARDFVRGWRRAMEPGTGTDYTFLFTGHIQGADEYVRWRRKVVGVLTALCRLRDGWEIDAAQTDSLMAHPIFQQIRSEAGSKLGSKPPENDDRQSRAAWLSGLALDWRALHDEIFDKHAAEMALRFNRVGIKAVDDRTLVVKLTRPCPYFLDLTAFPTFLPCHESIERLHAHYRGAAITREGLVAYDPQWTKPDYRRNGYPGLITNGPYRLSDWTFKRRIRLTVNPFYRAEERIACRTIDMLVYDSVTASILAYEAGRVDFLPAMDVPYDHEIARLARSGERRDFYLCDTLATYFLNFNCISESVGGRPNPFRDRRVRKAFSLAIDRDAIVHNVLGRGDRVAHSFVPAGTIPGYEPPEGLRHAPDEARRLLAEAGYPNGAGLPVVDLLYVSADEKVCQALARMWERALGVRLELRAKESKTFAEDKANHRFMIARGNWYADYNDPTTFLDCLLTGNGNNDSGFSDPRYDSLLARAAEAPPDRAALLQAAERIIDEQECPILPILHYAQPIAIKPYVHGLSPNPRLRFAFQYVSMEP